MTLRAWLVRLYPPEWRRRYGTEFDALLEECLHTPLDVLDIVLGAFDAHLELSRVTDWRSTNLNNKRRTAVLLVFTAYIAFVVAGLGVYGFADDSPFIPMMRTNAGLFVAWTTLQVGALVALAAVVIGSAPLAWITVQRALTSRRQDLRLLLVPVAAFVALIAYLGAAAYITGRSELPPGSLTGRMLLWGLVAVFVLGAVTSVIAVWRLVTRNDADAHLPSRLAGPFRIQPYEFATIPSVVTALSMLVMFVASLAWFWLAFSARPDVLAGDQGPLMLNSRLAFAATLLLMLGALITAAAGLRRLQQAPRA